MTKITAENMNAIFAEMLLQSENSVCPIYCAFREKSFFPTRLEYGYCTCTDTGRLLIVRYCGIMYENQKKGAAPLTAIKNLKIKKTLIGQYKITITFATEKKDFKLMLQIASKIAGGGFANQSENLQRLLDILKPYETVK